ncbi:MAG TPA: radical SAM protein [Vicinamibacterales bacterium]|nr:radical SAM protein [Vicinamibacterales bacterium]
MNACEREIDLFCRGLRVPPDVSLEGARGIARTRAGLGSGLELAIPTGSWLKPEIWMNAPVAEAFARQSPYVLAGSPAAYTIRDDRDGSVFAVRLPREPAWYRSLTSRDVPMARIGVLQGTYLGIYINPVCTFWNARPALNCRFCTTGRNVGGVESASKTVEDVVETCWAAREESGITFVHLNGGFMGPRGIDFAAPFVKAIKEDVGLLVGVQLTPERDFRAYDRLIDLGVDHLSFCIELLDADWFARICPGKAKTLGQSLFFQAMEHCAARLPRGAVSGEIIAGLEPVANTLEGIGRIVSAGAFPTICIFRPTIGSDLEDWPPPVYEDMRRVMLAMYDACRRHRMPIGVAPNIEVSLVVNPDDAALLAPRTAGFYAYELWRRSVRLAARPVFSARLRARPRRLSGAAAEQPAAEPAESSRSA